VVELVRLPSSVTASEAKQSRFSLSLEGRGLGEGELLMMKRGNVKCEDPTPFDYSGRRGLILPMKKSSLSPFYPF